MRLRSIITVLILLGTAVGPFRAAAEEAEFGPINSPGEEAVPEEAERPRPIKGFGAYRSKLGLMCARIEKDGQRAWLSQSVKAALPAEKSCKACRALLVVVAAACPVKKSSVKKTPAPKPSPTPEAAAAADATPAAEAPATPAETPADVEKHTEEHAEEHAEAAAAPTPISTRAPAAHLDPSLEVLDVVSDLFRKMAEDEKAAEDNFIAVRRLADLMLEPGSKTVQEKHYYETVAAYMLAPFEARGIGVQKTGSPEGESEAEKPPKNVDSLFDF